MLGNLQNLEQYMEKNSMNVDTVRQMGLEICKALESGEPHGDIKMSTILVDADGHFSLDNSGEQTEADPSADVYALGMLMYRLLNKGRLPFMPPYPEAVSKEDKEKAISRCLSGEAFPIPVNGDRQIADILHTACHPDRTMRYHTFREMEWALGAPANTSLEKSEPQSSQEQTTRAEETTQRLSPDDAGKVQNVSSRAPGDSAGTDTTIKKTADRGKREEQISYVNEERSVSRLAQGIFVILSAALAIAYIALVKSSTIVGAPGQILYGYCVIQAILVILAMKNQGYMKVLGICTILDMLYVLLYGVLLESLLAGFGVSMPAFYNPGTLAVVLPIVEFVVYILTLITKGKIQEVKIKFFTFIMLVLSLIMLVLGLTGFNLTLFAMKIYPYEAGILLLFIALIAIESKSGRIVGKVMCVLTLLVDIVLMLMHTTGFSGLLSGLGVSVDGTLKITVGLLFLFSLLSFVLSGRKKAIEYED